MYKKTSLYTPLLCPKGRANIFHMAVWCCTHMFTWQVGMWSLLLWSQRKKDTKVETRNLTQGIHILLFIYLVVDLDGFIDNARLRQHYATFEPKNRIGQIWLCSRWRQTYKLVMVAGFDKRSATERRRKSTNVIFLVQIFFWHFVRPTGLASFCFAYDPKY